MSTSGVTPTFVFASEDNGVVQSLVAAGVGSALVPRLAMDASMSGTRLLELSDGPPARRLGLVWNPDRLPTPAESRFIAAAEVAFAAFAACDGAFSAVTPSAGQRRRLG